MDAVLGERDRAMRISPCSPGRGFAAAAAAGTWPAAGAAGAWPAGGAFGIASTEEVLTRTSAVEGTALTTRTSARFEERARADNGQDASPDQWPRWPQSLHGVLDLRSAMDLLEDPEPLPATAGRWNDDDGGGGPDDDDRPRPWPLPRPRPRPRPLPDVPRRRAARTTSRASTADASVDTACSTSDLGGNVIIVDFSEEFIKFGLNCIFDWCRFLVKILIFSRLFVFVID